MARNNVIVARAIRMAGLAGLAWLVMRPAGASAAIVETYPPDSAGSDPR